MTPNELREYLNRSREALEARASSQKDSMLVPMELTALYRGLTTSQQDLANETVIDWVLSGDDKARYDGQFLISHFDIVEALPALRELGGRLGHTPGPSASNELRRVERLISQIESVVIADLEDELREGD